MTQTRLHSEPAPAQPEHHIPPALLLDYAAGSLGEAWALVVACHLTYCPHCRNELRAIEATGGALLETTEPALLRQAGLEQALQLLETAEEPVPGVMPGLAYKATQDAVQAEPGLPRPLAAYLKCRVQDLPWRWSGAGLHSVALPLAKAKGGMVSLLRIESGRAMPLHSHGGEEMTLVLSGGFTDERGAFRRGDVECADGSVEHQPVAMADQPCICLAVTDAPLRFRGSFGWILNQWARLAS